MTKTILALLSLTAGFIYAESYVAFSRANNGTNNIIIPNGEIWKLVNWSAEYTGVDISVVGAPLYWTNVWDFTVAGTYGSVLSAENLGGLVGNLYEGPFTFVAGNAITNGSGNYYIVFKKIIGGVDDNLVVGSTSVVIPSNTTGDVDIKLEQSADQVTWTECQPGNYNSSTVKRFFRLRAVEK